MRKAANQEKIRLAPGGKNAASEIRRQLLSAVVLLSTSDVI